MLQGQVSIPQALEPSKFKTKHMQQVDPTASVQIQINLYVAARLSNPRPPQPRENMDIHYTGLNKKTIVTCEMPTSKIMFQGDFTMIQPNPSQNPDILHHAENPLISPSRTRFTRTPLCTSS